MFHAVRQDIITGIDSASRHHPSRFIRHIDARHYDVYGRSMEQNYPDGQEPPAAQAAENLRITLEALRETQYRLGKEAG